MLNQQKLKKYIKYEQETGNFTWINSYCSKIVIGDICGCLDGHGYSAIAIFNNIYKAHRLAFLYMTGEFPKNQVDHINGIRDDNRWCNLREATAEENAQARKGKGFYANSIGKFESCIKVRGKKIHLGTFINEKDARNAYVKAKRELHPFCKI